jgi:hypothetical protein
LASAASGTTFGGRFESASTSGRGVSAHATAISGTTFGGRFVSDSTDGRGVFGLSNAGTGITYGVYGQSNSTSGRGVYGYATAGTGMTYGVYGESAATGGSGVYGYATANSGDNYGVYGMSLGTYGRGVVGWAGANNGTTYGVWGYSASGYSVYANGDIGASGVKPFRIDHPDDPENKYLLHYATESPEVMNFYSGKVILDAAGEAVVELPAYFAKINKDPRYTLTAVGAPMPMLHVAEEINEAALSAGATAGAVAAAPVCSFRIAGGAPGAKVSWRVEALRNDLWVRNRAVPMDVVRNGLSIQTRAMPVEVEKQGVEKGTYQHPELYGQPAERGMNYRPEDERASRTSPDATPQ